MWQTRVLRCSVNGLSYPHSAHNLSPVRWPFFANKTISSLFRSPVVTAAALKHPGIYVFTIPAWIFEALFSGSALHYTHHILCSCSGSVCLQNPLHSTPTSLVCVLKNDAVLCRKWDRINVYTNNRMGPQNRLKIRPLSRVCPLRTLSLPGSCSCLPGRPSICRDTSHTGCRAVLCCVVPDEPWRLCVYLPTYPVALSQLLLLLGPCGVGGRLAY